QDSNLRLRWSQNFVEQAKEKKSRWPLTHKNAPITLIGHKQSSSSKNGSDSSPIQDFFRYISSSTKVFFLDICCVFNGSPSLFHFEVILSLAIGEWLPFRLVSPT